MTTEEILKIVTQEYIDEEYSQLDIKSVHECKIPRKEKRNYNALFREELGFSKPPHPEADNAWERFRSSMYLKYPQYPRISRLYKSRKRREAYKSM